MFDFSTMAETWAAQYKPMQHTPEKDGTNKRFFSCEGIASIPAVLQNMAGLKSPIMMVESDIEGKSDGRFFYTEYHIFFACKDAEGMMNSGRTAKLEAATHMGAFIAYLRACKDLESDVYQPALGQINLNDLQYYSVNLFLDGWYGIQLDVVNIEPLQSCVNPADYV